MFAKLLFPLIIPAFVLLPPTEGRLSARPIVLVVSFDGFRHSYLNLTPNHVPILTNLSTTGATVPYMEPCFPTKTFPNHQSISTGLYTDVHGIVDNTVYDTKYNRKLNGKTNDPGFWNYEDTVLPLWIRNEQQGGVSGCMMWPGSSQGYGPNSALLPTHYYPGYNQGLSWESRVDTVIGWMTDAQKPANLVYLYYHEPDSAGHRYGSYGKETLQQVADTDRRVGVLVQKLKNAGIYNQVNLVFVSDHGIKEVRSDQVINLNQFVDRDRLITDINGETPVIQVVPKSGQRENLYSALKAGSASRNFQVYRKAELCGPPWYYCKGRRIHEFVTVADPGWKFADVFKKTRARKSRAVTISGSHGYINTAESMRVILIANGPAFKQGYKTPAPVKNIDVVPLLSKVLGLVNVPTNGTLSRVSGMLR